MPDSAVATSAGTASDGTATRCSPAMPRPSRLVARTRTPGQRCNRADASQPASDKRCSQLSRDHQHGLRSRRYSTMLSAIERPSRWRAPTASPTVWNISSPRRSAAASSHQPMTPSGEAGQQLGRHLQRQSGLAHAAHPGEGDETVVREHPDQRRELPVTADERRQLHGEVPGKGVERAEGSELPVEARTADLEDPQRLGQVTGAGARRGRPARRRPEDHLARAARSSPTGRSGPRGRRPSAGRSG